MSELKAETIVPQGSTVSLQMYPKAEADKVIDFWRKESHEHYERWFNLNKQYEGWFHKVMRCERAERKLLHANYKRCLAWVKHFTSMEAEFGGEFYKRWIARWTKLADYYKEKIKEGK